MREPRRLRWPVLILSVLVWCVAAVLRPDVVVAAPSLSPVEGSWLGGSAESPRVRLNVKSDGAGVVSCTLDAVKQGASGLPCENVAFTDDHFSFEVPVIGGRWSGVLSKDGQTLTGTWDQGQSAELTFHREAQPAVPAPPPAAKVSIDPAMPPVTAVQMADVLRADLREALRTGALAPNTGAGITVGVVRSNERRVFALGTATDDSIYEIGSITKTFTGLVLAQMIEQHKARLDEPVRELLPASTVAKPAGAEITLLDLVTHHSGLPSLPDSSELEDPATFGVRDLYAYISRRGVAEPANAPFLYSNLGMALLGQALAERSETSYSKLVTDEIIAPLGLHDTATSLSATQQRRVIQGHTAQHQPTEPWGVNAFAAAGALRSTAADMLIYLEANLHPEALPASATAHPAGRTLAAALTSSHELRADAAGPVRVAFAWQYNSITGDFMHDGVTGGYSAFAFFNPRGDYAAVVLMNTTVGPEGNFTVRLGQHIGARFAGKPAISLAN